jgi:nitroreductase
MKLQEAIETRRSVRNYEAHTVDKAQVEKLIHAAIQAPSASNSQPWSFAVIQDEKLLREYSDQAKSHLLANIDQLPRLAKYRGMLANPDFNIFYNAGTLITIYAKPEGIHPQGDCCLAAQNLMLAAVDIGLGTCWIGFATVLMNSPAVKKELGIPEDYTAVAPIIVGHPAGKIPQLGRDEPVILCWR